MGDVGDWLWPVTGLSFIWVYVIIIGGLVSLAALAFWIWMIVDCARREFDDPNTKLVWLLVIILTWLVIPLVGAIVYYFAGRPQGRLPEEK
ncbi:hypothetical protein AMK68_04715 [candidate division KD3-62 bacterium DG_56]|uniref:Cardiolipin synthase N-terminal domain-containing protein n=1 Tax=candidate division KD3-62 bacterium DG_56 TaxID=1704032 RepID=A0A0S7XL91_9BACT|nr:MAG: hypothetical protein AMK68_04715 [candidate division KD3-62 bacterium DG_56]